MDLDHHRRHALVAHTDTDTHTHTHTHTRDPQHHHHLLQQLQQPPPPLLLSRSTSTSTSTSTPPPAAAAAESFSRLASSPCLSSSSSSSSFSTSPYSLDSASALQPAPAPAPAAPATSVSVSAGRAPPPTPDSRGPPAAASAQTSSSAPCCASVVTGPPPSRLTSHGDSPRCDHLPSLSSSSAENPWPVPTERDKEHLSDHIPASSQTRRPYARSQGQVPDHDPNSNKNLYGAPSPRDQQPSLARPAGSTSSSIGGSEASTHPSNPDCATAIDGSSTNSSEDPAATPRSSHLHRPDSHSSRPRPVLAAAHATSSPSHDLHLRPPPPPPLPAALRALPGGVPSAATSSSPSMSHPPPPAGPPRQQHQQQQHHHPSPQDAVSQPVSYPSPAPHHYAPAGHGAPPLYGYPTPGGQPVDQYRQSPTGPPPHQLALPSMRSFDQQGHQHQQQHPQQQAHSPHPQHQHPQQPPYPQQIQHHPQQHQQHQQQQHQQHQQQQQHNPYQQQMHMQPGAPMGSTMAPGPHMSYFSIQPQPYAMHDPMGGMRYGLPPGLYDPRMQLSGGRHKKEIKRRTKTGCLTCRKRRIKCDETHPTCNNCKKSKRECLGYDPIFKQQQGPTALQPAPNGDLSPPASTTSSNAASTTPAPYTTHPTPILTPSEPSSATRDPCDDDAAVKFESPELGKASANIDPTLPATFSIGTADTPSTPTTAADFSAQQPCGEALQLRGGGSPFSFTPSSASAAFPSPLPLPSPSLPPDPPSAISPHAYSNSPAKMKVDDIVAKTGPPPPETSLMPTPQSVEELTKLYYEIYVPGLCQFFESQWFNFKSDGQNSIAIFLHNRPLISLLGSFLVSLHTVNSDSSHTPYCCSLEIRVVWALVKLAYTVPPGANMPRDDPLPDDNASEVRNRVYVFESLLNGDGLADNPLLPPPKNADAQRYKEYEFWYSLASFLLVRSDLPEQKRLLDTMRGLLDGRENRDLLYSLAVIRHLAPQYKPGWENRVPDHLTEDDPLNRLHVAIQFVKAEGFATGGTTNVVRQLSYLANKAFINPGFNISRNG